MRHTRANSRYAQALLQLADEKGVLEAVYADMKGIYGAAQESRELANLIESPIVSGSKKLAIFRAVFGDKVNELTMAFIELLTSKGRESILAGVAFSAVENYKEMKKIYTAEIASAVPLTDEIRSQIKEAARSIATDASEIELVEKVDSTLIGGFSFTMNHQRVDATVKGRIAQLKKEFDSNPYIKDF